MEELTRFFSSLQFAFPLYFWIGGAAIIFFIFLPLRRAKKGVRWDRGYWIKKIPALKKKKLWPLLILTVLISLLVALASAKPYIQEERSVYTQEKPVLVVIDVSGSMGAFYSLDKESYSFFDMVVETYWEIIGHDLGAAIGISFYSDQNYIARDFAEKTEYLSDTIENKEELQEISGGTETADALFSARMFFAQKIRAKNETIILISDLVDNLDFVSGGMRQVLKEDINLYVIVVAEGPQIAYEKIQTVKSQTGGSGAKMFWSGDKEGIDQIRREISKMESSLTNEKVILSQKSLLPFILPAILGLIVLSIIISETVFRKIP